MTSGGRPLRFIAAILGVWIAGRVVWSLPMEAAAGFAEVGPQDSPLRTTGAAAASLAGLSAGQAFLPAGPSTADMAGGAPASSGNGFATPRADAAMSPRMAVAQAAVDPHRPGGFPGIALMGLGVLGMVQNQPGPPAAAMAGQPQPPPRSENRLSGSAWLFGRSAAAPPPLATGGQLAGSQFGARLVYRIAGQPSQPISAFARVSGPISQRGREVALGLEAQPLARVPVRIAVERRIALEEGAASGLAISAIGGGSIALPRGLQLDAYGKAGVIGLRRRAAFVDGAAVVTGRAAQVGGVPLRVGAGIWGGAQPGAARLDVGPRVEAGVPVAGQTLRLGLDWRERIAGQASPGSGPAVTVGADF